MPEATPLQMVLTTSLGDVLKLRSMSGHEEVSRLFEYQLLARSSEKTIAADDLLGTPVAVSLETGVSGEAKRWFHGIVAGFGIDGVDGRDFSYRLTVRPWLWLLTRAANVRIFQELSVPEIVKQVLQAYSGTVVDELGGSYAKRTYCVQYRET